MKEYIEPSALYKEFFVVIDELAMINDDELLLERMASAKDLGQHREIGIGMYILLSNLYEFDGKVTDALLKRISILVEALNLSSSYIELKRELSCVLKNNKQLL